jgi:hypothetical protein
MQFIEHFVIYYSWFLKSLPYKYKRFKLKKKKEDKKRKRNK